MGSRRSSIPFTLSICVVIVALITSFWLFRSPQVDIAEVLEGLQRLESTYHPFPQPQPGPLVMVGFGGCADLTVNALEFFDRLGVSSDAVNEPENSAPESSTTSQFELNTLDDVVAEFTEMFKAGAAAERYVKNASLFAHLVTTAKAMVGDPDGLSLGGNAPVMATRLAREGSEVSLVARLSTSETRALPPTIKVLSAPANFGLPESPETDVHLVLEFDKGSVWRNLTALRANRYILIRDEENPRLSSLWPGLMSAWRQNGNHGKGAPIDRDTSFPDLFVLGGLQTLDNARISPDIRGERLEALKHFLSVEVPRATLVHFEMASFVESAFVANLSRAVLPYVDSIGLNEQELPNLRSLVTEGRISSEARASTPRAAVMLDEMRTVWAALTSVRSGAGRRRLSRLHLHTLGYQVVMVRRPPGTNKAEESEKEVAWDPEVALSGRATELGLAWPHARAAAAKAALIAHRHTCDTASIDRERTRLLMDESFALTASPERWLPSIGGGSGGVPRIHFNSSSPVACWSEAEPTEVAAYGRPQPPPPTTSGGANARVLVCMAPVPVCARVSRTVGAGDNISAAALRTQLVAGGGGGARR